MTYENPWYYEGEIFDPSPEDIDQYAGFVYLIHNHNNDKMYIGKKFFWSIKKLPPLKGKNRRRIKKVQSDWKQYWGSSNKLLSDIEQQGLDNMERHVLLLCKSKTECAYFELKEQMDRNVLLSHNYYNEFIGGRINGKNILKE
jgi:hypothetical protein